MFADMVNKWSLLMSDTTPQTEQERRRKKDSLNFTVDGGVTLSKQAIWRTFVMVWVLGTGGGITWTKVENAKLEDKVAAMEREQSATNKATNDKLIVFRSVIDGVVNFLIEEKVQQKTKADRERYERQIEKIRNELKPIGKIKSKLYADTYAQSNLFIDR